jgi:hypothetical protein
MTLWDFHATRLSASVALTALSSWVHAHAEQKSNPKQETKQQKNKEQGSLRILA